MIIVYDEHGGFYDSAMPGPAVAPGDITVIGKGSLNSSGFDFTRHGVRVPAVIVSPLIKKGTVDHTLYDHASVLATLERILGLRHLTERDRRANDVRHLLTEPKPRTDCPKTLVSPAVIPKLRPGGEAAPEPEDGPLHDAGNTFGFLHVLLKAELEMSDEAGRAAILDAFKALTTVKQAQNYAAAMKARIEAAKTP